MRDIKDFWAWTFNPTLTIKSEIYCPKCKQYSLWSKWEEGSVCCEDCGEHGALICPNCGEYYDHVWSEEFITRNVE